MLRKKVSLIFFFPNDMPAFIIYINDLPEASNIFKFIMTPMTLHLSALVKNLIPLQGRIMISEKI